MKFKTKNFLAILGFIQSLGSEMANTRLYLSQECIYLSGCFHAYMPLQRQTNLLEPSPKIDTDVYCCFISELPQIKLKAKGLPEYTTVNLDSIQIDKYLFNTKFQSDNFSFDLNPYDSKEEVLFSKTYLKNLVTNLDKLPKPIYLMGSSFIASDDITYYSLNGGILCDQYSTSTSILNTSASLLKKLVSYFDTFYLTDQGLLLFDLSDELFVEVYLTLSPTVPKAAQTIPKTVLEEYKNSEQYLIFNNLKDFAQTLKDLKPLADRSNLVRMNLTQERNELIARLQPYNELETTAEVEIRFEQSEDSFNRLVNFEFIFSLNALIKYFDLVKSKEEVRCFLSNSVSPVLFGQKDLKLDCLIMPALGLG